MLIVCIQFSAFDVPLHYNFKQASDAGRNFDIRNIWDGTLVRARPIDAVYVKFSLPEPYADSRAEPLLTTTSKSA